jgi:hypothetical protein
MLFGQFGISPPTDSDVVAWWGARAISKMIHREPGRRDAKAAHEVDFDFVPDRKQFAVSDDARKAELIHWMRTKFEPWLAQLAVGPENEELVGRGAKEFKLDDGKFHAVVCARASHGYCYMGCWLEA